MLSLTHEKQQQMSLFINICEIVFTVQSGIIYFVKEKIPALSGALIALILKKQG